ncbi:two-component system, NtrC family, response regulator [Candidatus Kryptonium thompsonii]|jgi:DNA-binding NtrC family response regulator|uniref:Two-component system, NtrC family, response regulator n=1 Tax=Candidatus Kryptonium thompsonii TaxID=1633631 RepID=A0A0P1MEY9_9BACT|nr:sigma-54 dependent transcriptional regulator [Candidatus Kryptonium thompsoni]CUS76881.1 two-component system, NtrC family, response regulator [Candidatus Kryptonium thompsoni]CUS84447.1 two-component system, NtrC family, response regulator [Candidatus Kryptonium thompsoni]CUS92860.1 two-component system, NtrC family, response regulator [Candidatus Kryptonium thompsoni]CUT01514.1 two-component system, NtrC family, response regulator [Candidatus Kryptonium thompsoni]CUT05520.1 two-component 
MKVVIIEDEKIKRITLRDALLKEGYEVVDFESPIFAVNYIEQNDVDVVVTDIRLPDMDGMEVLKIIKKINPNIMVIMITAYGTIENAVEAMKLGAYDYITKPFSSERLIMILKKIEKYKELEKENIELKKRLDERYSFSNIVGKSKAMQNIYSQIEIVAQSDATVLIIGESGTGKDLVANAIHQLSPRKNKPFVKLSCASLPETLLETELFGHEKGAFTGAIKERKGKFECANGGTLFLDDVDDIPLSSQVKLLNVIQEKRFERIGGNESIKVDVRLICASKVDLFNLVKLGKFREDLYYRMSVIPIKIPPLRERREDIPLLIEHFLNKFGRPELKFTPEAMEAMIAYEWPGNVRQLENIVQRIVVLTKGNVVTREALPSEITGAIRSGIDNIWNKEKIDLEKVLADFEQRALRWALEKSGYNQTKAAEILNLKRTTLREKMKKYGLI